MHDLHILVPWNRVDEWHEWMDQRCPGWVAHGEKYFERQFHEPGTARDRWRRYLANIRANILRREEGTYEANYAIAVDTDQQLMLLRLTWNVVHVGRCDDRCKTNVRFYD